MAFISKNFSPVGANAKAGNAPQVFSYISQDNRSVILTNGYFNEMKGVLHRGDWITSIKDADGSIGMSTEFVTGDGQSPSFDSGSIDSGGTATYVQDEQISVTFVDGDVIHKPTFNIDTVSTGVITAISIVDPGLYNPKDPPTTLTGLAVTGGSGTAATVDVVLTGEAESGLLADIRLSPLGIIAA